MTEDELRAIRIYLEERIVLESPDGRRVLFDPPGADEMTAAGLNADGVAQLLAASWWPEMVEDVLETPEFCDPGETPETVLRYARDLVQEYLGKRFAP